MKTKSRSKKRSKIRPRKRSRSRSRKNYKVINLLIADPRQSDQTLIYVYANKNGHSDIVDMLFSDPRVDHLVSFEE